MLFKVLRRVCLLSWNIGQWRRKWEVDSILEPQLQSGFKQFWKLYLNLCSRKWLNSSRSRVINLIPLRLQQLKKLFGLGLINLILFLKTPKFSELWREGSRLFHSMIDDGKKTFLWKLWLILCLIIKDITIIKNRSDKSFTYCDKCGSR